MIVDSTTPYRNKSFIVTDIEYDKYLKTEEQIKDLDFKVQNAYGIWYGRGRNNDEKTNDLWEKIEQYLGCRLNSNTVEHNKPHRLTSFL